MRRVLTFGTFDLFHYGHLRILERASKLGDELYVGVSSDHFSLSKKGYYPIYKQEERMHIISSLGFVHGVFLEETMEKKREYLLQHKASVLVMGHDWEGKFDDLSDAVEVVYLPRTPLISTSELIQRIKLEY